MHYKKQQIPVSKTLALVAHDNCKFVLLDWVFKHQAQLEQHRLCATGTTGQMIEKQVGITLEKLVSGPLGGDQQIGAKISQGEVDVLIFFWDPLN